jgi:signal transduction histidine kinase
MPGARTPWVIAGVAGLLTLADTAMVAASYGLMSTDAIGIHGWPMVNIAALGTAVIGAVILGSHPRHPIGMLLNLIGLTTSISLAAESYGIWVLEYDGPGSATQADLGGWTAAVLGGPLALAGLTVVFLVVPGGNYLSPGWRWVARTAWAGYAAFVAGLVLVGPSSINRNGDPIDAGLAARTLLSGGVVLITLMIVASVVSIAIRLRSSSGVVRDQVRVVGFGAAFVGLALVTLIVGQSLQGGRQSWWSSVPLFASYASLIVCLAVAVLRYRLYEVELIISRALVLAIATAFVAIGYIGLVVALGQSLGSRADGGFWVSLLATVVVALAFQPARRSVVRIADRLAYGNRAAPYDALADFSRRIGRSPVPGQLLPTIAAAAGEAVHADRAVVRLDGDEATGLTASWPPGTEASDPADGDVLVPVHDAVGVLGSISLTLPPGRDVRPLEQRLLSDIAEQAALALRNVRLQIELAARVRQLDQRTRELAASRSRIIDAADAERRRLEAEIGRRVLPTMRRLREEVGDSTTGAAQAERINAWIDRVTEALDSLRELTRGIYPTMLTRSGLGPALTSYAARAQRAGSLRIDPGVMVARYPARVEAAAYFSCVEVLERPAGDVDLDLEGGELVLSLRGVSLDALDRLAILDRVEACEGSLDVLGAHPESSLRVRLPVAAPA